MTVVPSGAGSAKPSPGASIIPDGRAEADQVQQPVNLTGEWKQQVV